ncbi:hypothetical protein BGX27_009270, partial [Mortierella sp. AM989]
TRLYATGPTPFGNTKLFESYWARQGWPIIKELLSDIDENTMIDGEKCGLESAKRKGKDRRLDLETRAPRKPAGKKLDLVARDTTNDRDWFLVESMKSWNETSTKFLHEVELVLFKQLHLIAVHRIKESKSTLFKNNARFFSLYSGDVFVAKTIDLYNQTLIGDEVDEDSWIYQIDTEPIHDTTLASSPLGSDGPDYGPDLYVELENMPLSTDESGGEALYSDTAATEDEPNYFLGL